MKTPHLTRLAVTVAIAAAFVTGRASLLAAESTESLPGLFPFVLPWDDSSPGVTDMSGLLHKPAGKFGHIRAGDDGHFYAGQQRARFFGVNVCFAANVPEKVHAEKAVGRMAKFGINVVRFHHADTSTWPRGLRERNARGSGELVPEALDRFDYFIAQLKQAGIYANVNLLVGRRFTSGDGLPAEIEKLEWKDSHIVGFWNAKHLELQKDYARKLLARRNPYTQLTLAEDPAVAFVEINNENGLLHAWHARDVDAMPEVFLGDLRRQWNEWLKARHGDTAKLRAAWSEGEQPLGAELLANGGLARGLERWNLEQHAPARMTGTLHENVPTALRAKTPAAKVVRLTVAQTGQESWHLQFNQNGLPIRSGQSYTLAFWVKADAARELTVSVSQAHAPWNVLWSGRAAASAEWKEFRFAFPAAQADDNARVSVSGFGNAGAATELAGFSLKPGGLLGLRAGESLESSSVAYFEKRVFGERTVAAQRDWMRFLQATEDRYWQSLYRFLKDELKVKGLITGTIVGCSPPNLMAKMDWVDTHSYWQHPHFPRRPWDPADWTVQNKTMVNERGGTLPGLALKRVAGKPHACTEYNHSSPNTYGSECALLLAAYAALQDWDALYFFTYSHAASEAWGEGKIQGFFDFIQHPTKMATLPAAAAMFLRGDVKAAQKLVVAELGAEKEAELLRRAGAWSLVDAGTAGVPREAALVHRVALATEGIKVSPGSVTPDPSALRGSRLASDTGELLWDLTAAKRGVVTVNAPRSKAVIGFGGGKRFVLGDVVIEPGPGLQDGWSAITVTGLGDPDHWLITATGYADNTGLKWHNPEKNTVGRDWGQAPSRVEGVPAKITFPASASKLEAWSLDERGQRKDKLPVGTAGGQAMLELDAKWKTLWYEVIAK